MKRGVTLTLHEEKGEQRGIKPAFVESLNLSWSRGGAGPGWRLYSARRGLLRGSSTQCVFQSPTAASRDNGLFPLVVLWGDWAQTGGPHLGSFM